jgi:hypothetical protein
VPGYSRRISDPANVQNDHSPHHPLNAGEIAWGGGVQQVDGSLVCSEQFFAIMPIALVDHGPNYELVVVVSLKTGEITAEKLSSLTSIGVYVTGQRTG